MPTSQLIILINCLFTFTNKAYSEALLLSDQNLDTLEVDWKFETPQMYVYHEKSGSTYKFNEISANYQTLKLKKSGTVFSGILKLVSMDKSVRLCSYYRGIPHGVWKAYSSEGILIYKVNVKEGFYNGEAKFYNKETGKIRAIGHFYNGYPDGQFIEYSGYSNTNDWYEVIKTTLRTKFYDKAKALAKYTTFESYLRIRNSVKGVYVPAFSISTYLPSIKPSNEMYWMNEVKCQNYEYNSLPEAQVIIDGEYVLKDIHTNYMHQLSETGKEGAIKIKQKAFWHEGRCIWFEEYDGYHLPTYCLIRSSIYNYYNGYYTEERTIKTRINNYIGEYGIRNSTEASGFFVDKVIVNSSTLISSDYLHGFTSMFSTDGYSSIGAPDNKFSVDYNYSEGEYFLDKKIGIWKYYVVHKGKKSLVCTETYYSTIDPKVKGFKIGAPFRKLCNGYYSTEAILQGEQRFYNLNNGSFYVGYVYENGEAIRVIRE